MWAVWTRLWTVDGVCGLWTAPVGRRSELEGERLTVTVGRDTTWPDGQKTKSLTAGHRGRSRLVCHLTFQSASRQSFSQRSSWISHRSIDRRPQGMSVGVTASDSSVFQISAPAQASPSNGELRDRFCFDLGAMNVYALLIGIAECLDASLVFAWNAVWDERPSGECCDFT